MLCDVGIDRRYVALGRTLRSNHSTWDPRRPLYEELQPPPVPARGRHGGSDECYHPQHRGKL